MSAEVTKPIRRTWSVPEEALLRTMAKAGEPASLIATSLNRTEKAVFARANLLGLKITARGRAVR